ncbi:MAG: nucleotidyltransferase [Omnitrophica WOR_2 bacterium GWA2_45_18]|nr:MAG: nucleotidyltransferase [Omnitrophica WOR_2 bacterium GWA2_45_18]
MSPKEKILNTIRQHLKVLNRYGVKKIGLFGSFAQSSQKITSDIDILVEFKAGGKTFDNYMDLKFYLEKIFSKKVDLVIKDTLKSRIRNQVLSQVKYA